MSNLNLSGWRWSTGILASLALIPLMVILSSWLHIESDIWHHLSETVLGDLLLNTGILLLGVGSGVLVLGVGLAWLTTMCHFPGRSFFDWALILPLAMPAYVLAFTLLGFFDYGGVVREFLDGWFGVRNYWFPEVRSPAGVVIVLTLALYPYVYLLAREAFLSQGQRMMEVARVLGRGPWGGFFHAALPMARPAIAAGAALAVMESLADFGAVSIFNFDTFTTAIYKAWFGLFNLNAAAQIASLLLFFVFIALAIERYMRGKARYFTTTTSLPERFVLSKAQAFAALIFASTVFTLGFALPMAQLLAWVIQESFKDLDARYWDLLTHTLLLGGIAALLTTLAALLMGVARKRQPEKFVQIAVRLATLGYALPGSVLAVGVMLSFVWLNQGISLIVPQSWQTGGTFFMGGSLAALFFAYVVRFLAVAFGSVESGMERIKPSLSEAAQNLGAGESALLKRIYLPILKPSLLTALLMVLVEVMKEMPATLLLRPFGWDTLAVRIFEMTSEGEWERAALPALTLVLVGLLPVFFLVRKSARH